MGNIVQPLWAECPACTRILVVGYPTLSIALSFAMQAAPALVLKMFMCSLLTVVKLFCVWTMFLGAFFRPFSGGMSFLFLLMEVYMGMQLLPAKEKEMGSLSFLFWIFLMNLSVNVIYLSTMFILSMVQNDRSYWMASNTGLWPLIFIAITLQCLSNIDGSTSFWGVVSIPNKWYPLCLLGFFCLLSQGIMWNAAAAVLIGYAYPYIRLERLLPSRVRTNRWEQRCCGTSSRSCLGGVWLRAVDTAGYELESGDRRYATISDFGRSGQTQLARQADSGQQAARSGGSHQSNLVVFAGQGQRLGDGSEQSQPLQPAAQNQDASLAPPAPPPPSAPGA